MGLDMYLYAERRVSTYRQEDELKRLAVALDFPTDLITEYSSGSVRFPVGYWRKANAIHSWFVRHCQDGIDECQDTYVDRDKLELLLDACTKAYVGETGDLEPTTGFFFGSQDKDTWYYEDLKYTILLLNRLLIDPALNGYDFYYRSSW